MRLISRCLSWRRRRIDMSPASIYQYAGLEAIKGVITVPAVKEIDARMVLLDLADISQNKTIPISSLFPFLLDQK